MSFAVDRRDAIKLFGAGVAGLYGASPLMAQTVGGSPIELGFSGAKGAFRKHPRLAILSYPIRYIMAGEGNGGGSVGIFLTLTGPTAAEMTALATEARDDLASRLSAAGFPVVEPAAMLAEPTVSALPWTPGNGKWDEGKLDPMGRRVWFITGSPSAPLHGSWGSTSGASEFGAMGKLTVPSRAMDAVIVIPHLTLEFSTLTGTVNSGSRGSTSWAGGEILFGFKPHSITYYMAGGQRSIEMLGGSMNPKGRVIVGGVKLPGELRSGTGSPSPEMAQRLGRARLDEFAVDMPAWRSWVRQSAANYNAALVAHIMAARSG